MRPILQTFLFLILCSCSSQEEKTPPKGEFLYRMDHETSFIPPPTPKPPPVYSWTQGHIGNIRPITKEYFRCRGSQLNPARLEQVRGETVRYGDCGGAQKHSLPLKDGKEFIYPILIEVLNHVQKVTGKQVVVTCGHRCPDHNNYVNSSPSNQASKHMIGAEVTFYVQGLEQKPEEIVKIIQDYYKGKDEFKRYEKQDTNVSTQPWMNKELFIKLYKKTEGRDFDNRHPYPYISLQVRYDRDKNEKVAYSWDSAWRNFMRY